MNDDGMKKPLARKDVTVQMIGDEVMLYDGSNEKIHVLNHTAFAIWQLCNGANTAEEIKDQLAAQYPDAGNSLLDDIKLIINDFINKSLIL